MVQLLWTYTVLFPISMKSQMGSLLAQNSQMGQSLRFEWSVSNALNELNSPANPVSGCPIVEDEDFLFNLVTPFVIRVNLQVNGLVVQLVLMPLSPFLPGFSKGTRDR